MRKKAIFSDGVFPAKHKALLAAVIAVSARCEPCIRFYVTKARELGASEAELGEFLAVASTMGGCVGEMWSLKAFRAFKNETGEEAAEDHCCT